MSAPWSSAATAGRRRRARPWRAAIGCGLLLALAAPGQRDVTEQQPWQFDAFVADAGLQGRSVLHCALAADGTIWFATSAGLVAYDGYRWERYGVAHGLPSEYVRCVAFTAGGELWVGTDAGAVRFDRSQGKAIPTTTRLAGPSVRRIVADPRSDALWFCCDQWPDPDVSAGLSRLSGGDWRTWTEADGLPSDYIMTMLIDARGRHFVGTRRGLVELRDGAAHRCGPDGEAGWIWSIAESPAGGVLAATESGVLALTDGGWRRILAWSENRPLLCTTHDGVLMVSSRQRRVFRLEGDRLTPLSAEWGVRCEGIEHALEDQDGGVWLAGHEDLLRWRRGGEWSAFAGCPPPILLDAFGGVWFDDGRSTLRFADGAWQRMADGAQALCAGPDGAVWTILAGVLVRWLGPGPDACEAVDAGVAEPRVLCRAGTRLLVLGGGAGEASAACGDAAGWTRVAVPAAFRSADVRWQTGGNGEAWLVTATGPDAAHRLWRYEGVTLREVPLPAAARASYLPQVVVDPRGVPWLYGMFGLFQRQGDGWQQVSELPGRHVFGGRRIEAGLALATRPTSGGAGAVSFATLAAGEEPAALRWRHVRLSAHTALGVASDGAYLVSDAREVHAVDPRGPVRSLRLPSPARLDSAVRGPGGELWLGAADGLVLRFAADRRPPRARIQWLPHAIAATERLELRVEAVEWNRPRADSQRALATVTVDGRLALERAPLNAPLVIDKLPAGDHRLAIHIVDEGGDATSEPTVHEVRVLGPPLQEAAWFWPLVWLVLAALLGLTLHSLRAGRHIAAHARTLEQAVSERTAELRSRDESLLHAQKMEAIGRLAGGVAHDFNNLLTVILGNLELARAALAADPRTELAALVGEVEQAARRAAELTRQLLAFSRREPWSGGSADLAGTVRSLAAMLQRVVGGGVTLRVRAPDAPLRVACSRTEIEQILSNLVVNARDAMPEGGTIDVDVELAASITGDAGDGSARASGRLVVRDQGHGMPPEVLARAFEPYFTTKARGQGTGLGLPIVHGVVTRAGGEIEVRSAAQQGTTVTVSFPLAGGDPALESGDGTALDGSGRTALVCEDEPAVLQLIRRALGGAGYRVLAGSSVLQALELEAGHPGSIDVLVTDVVLPERSGIELAREVARRRPGLPVLFISGFAGEVFAQHGIAAGDLHLLRKPFDPAMLQRAVADVLAAGPNGGNGPSAG